MEVYHGSLINIKDNFLKPNKAFNSDYYTPCVYVTPSYINALLYSVNPIASYMKKRNLNYDTRAFSTHINFDNEQPIVYEMYEGMFKELFDNMTSFIYVCNISDLKTSVLDKQMLNKEILYKDKLEIKKRIVIPNFYNELLEREKNNEVILKRFETWDSYEYYNYIFDHLSAKASLSETCGEIIFYKDKFADNDEIQKSVNIAMEKKELWNKNFLYKDQK